MTTLLSNNNLNLYYLTLYDRNEIEYILSEENKLREQEGLELLTIKDIENRDIIISKKNNKIDGYSITNFTFDANNNVKVLIERLHESNKEDKFLNSALFESAMFVAMEKAMLGKNLDSIPNKIISSSVIIEGHTINFNITEEYMSRNLNNKFNKEAVKQKLELDEKYKKEREKIKNKISANTFYNDSGHRFHGMVDEKTNQFSVVENDFDMLNLDERLKVIQKENINKEDLNLDEAYQKFEKEKIETKIEDSKNLDSKKLNEEQKDLVATATILSGDESVKVDLQNNMAFNKENKKIDVNTKKENVQKIGGTIERAISKNIVPSEIDSILKSQHIDWNSLDNVQQEKILDLYGVNNKELTHSSTLNNTKPKSLIFKNNNQAAFASYVIISFISGLSAGFFIALLLMFINR